MRYISILFIKIAQLCFLHMVYSTSFQFHSVLSYLKDGYWSMLTPSVLSENKLFNNKKKNILETIGVPFSIPLITFS